MTAREAIEILQEEHDFAQLLSYVNEALQMAIAALEKQIPKKPLDKEQEYDGEYGLCPNCKKVVSDFREFKRCYNCGQALDWSDTE